MFLTFAEKITSTREFPLRVFADPLPVTQTNLFQIRPSIQDVQRNGLPLCEVALFQNAAIPSPLAAKPERDTHLQLKVASRTSSLRSPAASARSIRSRSTKASLKDTYEARTWRNRLRRHSVCHSFPPECLFLSNEIRRSHQDYMSQLHAAHHASSK